MTPLKSGPQADLPSGTTASRARATAPRIPAYGSANRSTQGCVAHEGHSMTEYINMQGMTYNYNSVRSDMFKTVEFTNYDGRASGSNDVATSTWYDSFIVSTQPIPAPNGPAPQ